MLHAENFATLREYERFIYDHSDSIELIAVFVMPNSRTSVVQISVTYQRKIQ